MTGQTTWNELISQPNAWRQLLARLDVGKGRPAVVLADYDKVVAIGSGTSYYLALSITDFLRRRGIDARAIPSCEVVLDAWETRSEPACRRLAIAISRSGESSELLMAVEALQRAGVSVLGVTCTAKTSLLACADEHFLVREGHENGLVMLRSFTGMLIALQHLFGSDADRTALTFLPGAGDAALASADAVRALVQSRPFDRFVFLGSGPSYPIACEASLKVQEMSIATSEAYHSLEYRHGPKATAGANTLVSLFALEDDALGLSLVRDIMSLGASVLVLGSRAQAYAEVADLVIAAGSDGDPGRSASVDLLPLQILAYENAMKRGRNPDAPVNLSKVVLF